jgi:hypothetical protein
MSYILYIQKKYEKYKQNQNNIYIYIIQNCHKKRVCTSDQIESAFSMTRILTYFPD